MHAFLCTSCTLVTRYLTVLECVLNISHREKNKRRREKKAPQCPIHLLRILLAFNITVIPHVYMARQMRLQSSRMPTSLVDRIQQAEIFVIHPVA
jgi:hypothetical protein